MALIFIDKFRCKKKDFLGKIGIKDIHSLFKCIVEDCKSYYINVV